MDPSDFLIVKNPSSPIQWDSIIQLLVHVIVQVGKIAGLKGPLEIFVGSVAKMSVPVLQSQFLNVNENPYNPLTSIKNEEYAIILRFLCNLLHSLSV